ncbi:inositol monophosphatase [Dehalococcoidia bacterium]|nr:inositol monophosphatase [Dehalococcoidia bacterium]
MAGSSFGPLDDVRFLACLSWVVEAGEVLRGTKNQQAIFKDDGSPATAADYEIRDLFRAKLNAQFPQDALSTEEDEGGGSLECEYLWILDPVDGTLNFLLGLPFYSVSVGIFQEGEPVFAVVYDPVHRHLFIAQKGEGAWLNPNPGKSFRTNGRRLKLEEAPSTPRPIMALRLPFETSIPSCAENLLTSPYKFRWLGSTSLQICYCALGAISAVVDHKATIWDIAGAGLILLESGGFFRDFAGNEIFPLRGNALPSSFSIVAAVPGIYETLAKKVESSDLKQNYASGPGRPLG